eukprot:COSAG02_NODE_29519_length_567_cov_3.955128_1_plen_149_part_01
MSLCVLPHAVLGSAPFVPAGMLLSVGGVCACGVEGVCGAVLDAERLRVSCCCFLMCGMDATGNRIGNEGALALAKALESGQCQLKSLNLSSESVCLAACGAGLCAFRSGWHASFGRWRVCVRAEWRVCVALLDAERLRVSCCCFLMCGM